jgi:hypothetical protein
VLIASAIRSRCAGVIARKAAIWRRYASADVSSGRATFAL